MRLHALLTFTIALTLFAFGCKDDIEGPAEAAEEVPTVAKGTPTSMAPPEGTPGEGGEAGETAAEKTAEKAAEGVAPEKARKAMETITYVSIAPQGSKFDPPVDVKKLPPGAWYCGKDTVHYAVMAKGQGTCPVCKASLQHLAAAKTGGEKAAAGSE